MVTRNKTKKIHATVPRQQCTVLLRQNQNLKCQILAIVNTENFKK